MTKRNEKKTLINKGGSAGRQEYLGERRVLCGGKKDSPGAVRAPSGRYVPRPGHVVGWGRDDQAQDTWGSLVPLVPLPTHRRPAPLMPSARTDLLR
ncbi:hypothetical protein E2C01_085293 [Portunus trituberculatus]|uniref:Uncharacterized protein n=1 Tax=Portunus trituberculatus TaxID=210409 RepID=A0A5B7J6G0_PORTR|nr:hypothetical protein [Portunus trituberculatus]